MRPRLRRVSVVTATAGLVAVTGAGCPSHNPSPSAADTAAAQASSSAPSPAPSPALSPPLAAAPPAPAPSLPALSTEQVADDGLPSKVGAGKLSAPTLKRLVEFFENKVGRAYAEGKPDVLDHYLAGPMLSGNRATINLLNSKHRRNVFRIRVKSVKAQSNQAHSVILTMNGDMVLDYFVDPRTHKVLDNGLPGPSQVKFIVFLNQNPTTGTWYWTGEKSAASSSNSTDGAETVG
jgi:hypothetical protein